MNYFKGIIFTKSSVLLKYFIYPVFKEHLENYSKKNLESLVIEKEFEDYANNFYKKIGREKEIKILEYFESSPFKDRNDYSNSLKSYLEKLIYLFEKKNVDSKIMNKLHETLSYCSDDADNIKNNDECKKSLDNGITFISMLGSWLSKYSSILDYSLKSIIFAEKINKSNDSISEYLQATSFWLENVNDLDSIAIYLSKPKMGNSPFFEETFSKELLEKFKKRFENELKDEKTNNCKYDSFEIEISDYYNKKDYSNEKIKLNPIFLFQIQDLMPIYSESLMELDDIEKQGLIDLSISCKASQDQLYQGKVPPELTFICLEKSGSSQKFLIAQKEFESSKSNCCIYEMINGDKKFHELCLKINSYLSINDFDEMKNKILE